MLYYFLSLVADAATIYHCASDHHNFPIDTAQTFPYPGRVNAQGGLRIQFRYTYKWDYLQTNTTGLALQNINSKLLKVQQQIIVINSITCGDIYTPWKDIGVQFNKDLIIYARTYSTGNFYAQAAICVQRASAPKRSTFGLIGWNTAAISNLAILNNYGFQSYLRITLHQVIHLLGFSFNQFDSFTVNPFKISGGVRYFAGPNVRSQVIRYYNCSNPVGMPLQNSEISSHWQKDVVMDQLMSPNADNSDLMFLSNLTLNVLLDSGWYSSINFNFSQTSFMRFGKNKGCSFLTNFNCSNPDDFCQTIGRLAMKYYNNGYGYCQTNSYSSCLLSVGIFYYTCKYEYYFKALYSYEQSGAESNSFISELTTTGAILYRDIQCFKNYCENNSLKVQINSVNYTCSNGGTIQIPNKGNLTCPSSVAKFCQSKMYCVNNCGKNGICIKGICLS